ncbi:hypothetical protein AA309_12265 [Microvirga vignae]|uniref:Uncharacterized protein n=1 Tax=Microvirga vignae TaxID=1225564 RepID=A0A0H1RCB1_9HYPH|nr:hypothetical protein [Microvirga vignae]KLK92830.1 hypothetical protein AA309_12265 [Microvirga vignae]
MVTGLIDVLSHGYPRAGSIPRLDAFKDTVMIRATLLDALRCAVVLDPHFLKRGQQRLRDELQDATEERIPRGIGDGQMKGEIVLGAFLT